jgi:hypothetical protein
MRERGSGTNWQLDVAADDGEQSARAEGQRAAGKPGRGAADVSHAAGAAETESEQ